MDNLSFTIESTSAHIHAARQKLYEACQKYEGELPPEVQRAVKAVHRTIAAHTVACQREKERLDRLVLPRMKPIADNYFVQLSHFLRVLQLHNFNEFNEQEQILLVEDAMRFASNDRTAPQDKDRVVSMLRAIALSKANQLEKAIEQSPEN